MQRRKYLAAIGSLAAGGAAAMGTGAFTSSVSGRDVSVNVVQDPNAYVGINPTDERSSLDNGQLSLDFSDSSNGANGLNPNSRTSFHDLFEIRNQGDNDVVAAVGVRKSHAYIGTGFDSSATEFSNSAVTNGTGQDLLQEYPGIDVVYTFAERPSGLATGIGNPPAIKVDGGNRAWLTDENNQGELLGPGEAVSVDLDIQTNATYSDPAETLQILVLAVEPGSDRDLRDGNYAALDTF
ncbi:hypothetical protein [Salinirarus marinus]